MRSKITFSLLIFNLHCFSYAADSITFVGPQFTRVISLENETISFDTVKGQRESKKVSTCVMQQFHLESKKLINYKDKKCSHKDKILVKVEGLQRTVSSCGVALPHFEEMLTKILNCGK